ncbi:hypothetical protein BBAD15_g7286 [Beauveria bassiana D1-5]|uniref:Uncharacterized protein n=1 Tax=Beauveria bassiana D1-5 TaxID=1245745 RepID=A0A0A2W333_BEABA|nr:hypothetical protein BBAD15_g7286 [Beauveria bassiana D1-5]
MRRQRRLLLPRLEVGALDPLAVLTAPPNPRDRRRARLRRRPPARARPPPAPRLRLLRGARGCAAMGRAPRPEPAAPRARLGRGARRGRARRRAALASRPRRRRLRGPRTLGRLLPAALHVSL